MAWGLERLSTAHLGFYAACFSQKFIFQRDNAPLAPIPEFAALIHPMMPIHRRQKNALQPPKP